jgi:polysaccharide export outer membrane protein
MRLLPLALLLLATAAAPLGAQVQLRSNPTLRNDAAPPRAQAVAPRAQIIPPRAAAVPPAQPAVPPPQSGGADQTVATLRVGDSFEVRLSGMEAPYGDEFSRQYLVDSDGTVNFPYINAVRAAGYTPGQLERVIQQKLVTARIFTTPTVNITMQTTARVVAVTGGVRAPQRLPWTSDLTVASAVDLCGGVDDFGSEKGVKLIRNGTQIGVFDLRKLRKDPSLDVKVLPGDQITVPK